MLWFHDYMLWFNKYMMWLYHYKQWVHIYMLWVYNYMASESNPDFILEFTFAKMAATLADIMRVMKVDINIIENFQFEKIALEKNVSFSEEQ